MMKGEFLQQLNIVLKRLPKEERADIIQDYEEHFRFGLEEGKTEEESVATLGTPAQIAKEQLADYHLEKVTASATIGNVFRAFWAVNGLGYFHDWYGWNLFSYRSISAKPISDEKVINNKKVSMVHLDTDNSRVNLYPTTDQNIKITLKGKTSSNIKRY
jgi:hypothetical protein